MLMETPEAIFASDFHLSAARPGVLSVFSAFLEERVKGVPALYLLGDLFDSWTGRGVLYDPGMRPALEVLIALGSSGTRVFFLPGNRDFLLRRSDGGIMNLEVVDETLEADVGGLKVFLTHGDVFCTRDQAYQRMKRIIRNPWVMGMYRLLPGPVTTAAARFLRGFSKRAVSRKTGSQVAIDLSAVQRTLDRGFQAVICGHVHDPADHRLTGGGRLLILSDWTERGGTYAECRGGSLALNLFKA